MDIVRSVRHQVIISDNLYLLQYKTRRCMHLLVKQAKERLLNSYFLSINDVHAFL